MRKLFWIISTICLLVGCGQSYEETKRISREQRLKMLKEDSAAMKVAVLPTLDCLPIYLAEDHQLFDTVVDIRLKHFTAQMDVDTALMNNRVELGVTDLVRAERMIKKETPIEYLTATNAYWQLISNRMVRITDLKHLDDKMLAMTRYSVTDLLGDLAVDSAKLKPERVFRIQINDVNVRLKMLENNEMDALVMTEPQAAQARLLKHKVVLDTRKLDLQMGAIVMQSSVLNEKWRKVQLKVFIKGYNAACDSINKYGVSHYKDLVMKYCKVKREAVDTIPQSLKFSHIAKPRVQDIERAQKWLSKK
ncbi:MAG: ABC transporter substrate-binding protein [Prevotella sp.]|nr:ABC transporter substrate-binding protein [Prevotella sp.]